MSQYVRITHPLSDYRGKVGRVVEGDKYPEGVIVRFSDSNCCIFPIGGFEELQEQPDGVIYRILADKMTEQMHASSVQQVIAGFADIGLTLELDESGEFVVLRRIQVPANNT